MVVYNEEDKIIDQTRVMKSLKEDYVKKREIFREDRVIRMEVDISGKV